MEGSCLHSNESSGTVKGGIFLPSEQLLDCRQWFRLGITAVPCSSCDVWRYFVEKYSGYGLIYWCHMLFHYTEWFIAQVKYLTRLLGKSFGNESVKSLIYIFCSKLSPEQPSSWALNHSVYVKLKSKFCSTAVIFVRRRGKKNGTELIYCSFSFLSLPLPFYFISFSFLSILGSSHTYILHLQSAITV